MLNWIKEKILNVKTTTTTSSFSNSEVISNYKVFGDKYDNSKNVIDKTTIDYIVNKYKKELNKYFNGYTVNVLEQRLSQETIAEIRMIINLLLLLVNDDFFKSNRILKNHLDKLDSYIFSQYRKRDELKDNIYKLLSLLNNCKYGINVRENYVEYIKLINACGIDIVGLLKDYYVYLEDLDNNKKITEYLNKKYFFERNEKSIDEDLIKMILRKDVTSIMNS